MRRVLISCSAILSAALLPGCVSEWSPCEVECGEGLVCDPNQGACVKKVSTVDPQGEGGGVGQTSAGGGTGGNGGSGGGVVSPAGDLPCDVATVIGNNCASCHGAILAGNATFGLLTHADFTATSPLDSTKSIGQRSVIRMRASVAQMPPAPNARVQQFDLNVVDSWVNSGMPSGTCAVKPGTGTGVGGGGGTSGVGGGTSGAGGGTAGTGGGTTGTGGGTAGTGGGTAGTGGGGGTTTNPNYCKTCTASSQCGSTKNFCLGSGTTGACGSDCSSGQACPSTAHCVQIVNASNAVVGSNCVPTSGVCTSGAGGGGGTTGTGGGGGTGSTCTDTWGSYAKTWFSSNCASCHGTEFGTVSAVSGNKTSIRSRINSGNMPPGGAGSSSRTRIINWMDCGLKP